jgi:hypothetical protein
MARLGLLKQYARKTKPLGYRFCRSATLPSGASRTLRLPRWRVPRARQPLARLRFAQALRAGPFARGYFTVRQAQLSGRPQGRNDRNLRYYLRAYH